MPDELTLATLDNPYSQQELRADHPSWREQIAYWLMNRGGPQPSLARENFVSGLLGSTGHGWTDRNLGLNLADLTPLGMILGAQEEAQRGDYKAAAVNLIPGARAGKSVARAAERGIGNASRSALMYDPPRRPSRPFEKDYPRGAPADATGRLTHDVEGRPLTAKRVVGRRVVGGEDEALPTAELDALTKELTGSDVEVAPLGGFAGHYEKRPLNRAERGALTPAQRAEHIGFKTGIVIDRRLPPHEADRVLAHELGHAVNDIAGTDVSHLTTKSGRRIPFNEIPVLKDMEVEMAKIYRDLHRGWMPEAYGYKGDDVRSELMAEAIRAYMTDPNYIKTVAPKTAARIREHVNPNPRLNRAIQFNAIGAAAGATGAGAMLGTTMSGAPGSASDRIVY